MNLAMMIGGGLIGTVAIISALVLGPMAVNYIRMRRIAATGIAATAEVIALSDSGNRINHQPVANVQMTVTPPGGTAYQATSQATVSGINSPWYQPGRRLSVKFDAQHPERVAIMGPAP